MKMEETKIENYEDSFRRGPKKFNFWRGIYNKDKNYILGRTPKNWGQLAIFYAIFYIILAALFTICMYGLMCTLNEKTPKWTLTESRIGDNPGLGFRPMNISQGSLIWLKNVTTHKKYIDLIDTFLEPYEKATLNPHENSVNCAFDKLPPPNKVCRVNLSHFGNCKRAQSYGYNNLQPCVFLKLNRIIDWVPKTFVNASLPDRMPEDLKQYINSLPEKEKNQIFVSCEGEQPKDKENIGKITITPRGFPHFYYPYQNDDGYLSPLIAVQFESPKMFSHINVECIAWATNIIYHGGDRDRRGSVHFEILVDE